jgi:hypothetical protein
MVRLSKCSNSIQWYIQLSCRMILTMIKFHPSPARNESVPLKCNDKP